MTSVAATTGASLVPVMVTRDGRGRRCRRGRPEHEREGLDLGLVAGQVLDGARRHAVVPGHHAAEAGAGGVGA